MDINNHHLGKIEILKVMEKLYIFVKGLLQKYCLIWIQNLQKIFA